MYLFWLQIIDGKLIKFFFFYFPKSLVRTTSEQIHSRECFLHEAHCVF